MVMDGIRFLDKPGQTRLADPEEVGDYLRKVGPLMDAALEAEEIFGVDELEEFARRQRERH